MATQTYVVKKGDTLSKIAKMYKITLSSLEKANPQIKNFNLIYPKQKINIPVPPSNPSKPKPKPSPPPSKSKPKSSSTTLPQIALLNKPLVASIGKSPAGTAKIKGMFDNVSFSFNPEQITDEKGNEFVYTDTSNSFYPLLHYKGGKTPTIQFDLYVNDLEEEGACKRLIAKLDSHLPNESLAKHNGYPVNPMILSFGKSYVKRVWLEDYKIIRQQFNANLDTIEATISVSLIVHTG